MIEVRVRTAAWSQYQDVLKNIRRAVFVDEQGVPEAEEWDEYDAQAEHLLAWTGDGEAIGTARILKSDKITRMAVMPAYRGMGVGSRVLEAALGLLASRGAANAWLHAQIGAQYFYQTHGFRVEGERFLEAGIVHVTMSRPVHEGSGL